jgi:alkanesulfonate monooxygenase SsuD/methylene tetrahydromethanopterin reductase-like flavin-dependent oxidoreductase (luciferase family)
MRVGLVILPSDRWADARRQWEWAEDAGFCTAWTYDHIRWGGMPEGPWHAAIPVLSAAAAVTTRIRLGTLVATPNFRHPVTLARDAIALDDVSHGRLDLGVGPGSQGPDATALGQEPWDNPERMNRFEEFLGILRQMVDGGPDTRTSTSGTFYAAVEAPSTPGPLQAPLPLTVAAGGPRGLRLAAMHAQQWVTIGPNTRGPKSEQDMLTAIEQQHALLESACQQVGRDPSTIRKIVLWTPAEPIVESVDQFDQLSAHYEAMGFDQFVLHHPEQTGPYGGSLKVFEHIASRHAH